jgi:hypothetical protein
MVRFLMELTRKGLRAQVRVIPRKGCWEYIGACDAFGYGRVLQIP